MKRPGSLLGFMALAALTAACGSSSGGEEGVPPREPPTGQVVALTFDIAGNRLIKAYPHALYRSGDGGRGWEAIPVPPSMRRGRIAAVALPPKAVGTLYVAGPGFGVMRSQDDGATWLRLNRGLPNRTIEAFVAHAELETTLFAAVAGDGIYRTEDAGKTWSRMDRGPGGQIDQIVHSDLAGSMNTGWLYAATPEGLHRSMDCFCGWRPAGDLSGRGGAHSVVFDPDEPEHLYAAGGTGVFRSRDGGESWERVSWNGPEVISLAFDPSAEALYAATREGTIFRSRNQGALWKRVDE